MADGASLLIELGGAGVDMASHGVFCMACFVWRVLFTGTLGGVGEGDDGLGECAAGETLPCRQ